MLRFTVLITAFAAVASFVNAHPGMTQEELQAEILARSTNQYNLLHCEKKLQKRDGSSPSDLETIARRRIERVKALRRDLNLQGNGKWI
jgi:hypothetical protein